jgi:hypothetical protein
LHWDAVCLSLEKDQIYSLSDKLNYKVKLMSDSVFRGVSKIFALKIHQLDECHSHIVLSSKNLTIVLQINELTLCDITSIMNVNRNIETIFAYNVPLTSFVLFSTANRISIFDLSKIDSISDDAIRYEFNNNCSPWDFVDAHNLVLSTYSNQSQTISLFHLNNRPRDIDLVVHFADISLEMFNLNCEGVSLMKVHTTDTEIKVFVCTYSEKILVLSLDISGKLIASRCLFVDQIVESLELSKFDTNFIFIGTRNGCLIEFNIISNSSKSEISVGYGPVKLSRCSNESFIAYSSKSGIVFTENNIEVWKRRVCEWDFDTVVEIIYQPGKAYIFGIREDSIIYLSIPPISKDLLSKHAIISGRFFSEFLLLKSNNWVVAKVDEVDNSSCLNIFNSTGSELWFFDEAGWEIIYLSALNESEVTIFAVSVSKDKKYSKIQFFDVDSAESTDLVNEIICDGCAELVKCQEK